MARSRLSGRSCYRLWAYAAPSHISNTLLTFQPRLQGRVLCCKQILWLLKLINLFHVLLITHPWIYWRSNSGPRFSFLTCSCQLPLMWCFCACEIEVMIGYSKVGLSMHMNMWSSHFDQSRCKIELETERNQTNNWYTRRLEGLLTGLADCIYLIRLNLESLNQSLDQSIFKWLSAPFVLTFLKTRPDLQESPQKQHSCR